MLVAAYPASPVELTAGELEQIESALRNPARSEMLEGYDVGPQEALWPYSIELHQLVPFGEWPRPWVLVMVDFGERIVFAYDSHRAAELELAGGLAYLESEWADLFGEEDDDSDDD
jgi:hypothetical protein